MLAETIRVNGENEPLGAGRTLDALLAEKTADTSQRGIAVALNGSVVPRAAWRETVLRERQNARYRAVVDSATDPIVTTSDSGMIQWMNSAAERHFQFDATPFQKLLDVREERVKPREVEPAALLSSYLVGIGRVIDAVDRLEQ